MIWLGWKTLGQGEAQNFRARISTEALRNCGTNCLVPEQSNIFSFVQLKLRLDIKPHRVAHGHITEAISLLPGLNQYLRDKAPSLETHGPEHDNILYRSDLLWPASPTSGSWPRWSRDKNSRDNTLTDYGQPHLGQVHDQGDNILNILLKLLLKYKDFVLGSIFIALIKGE